MKAIVTKKRRQEALSHIIDTTLEKEIREGMTDYLLNMDALWLRWIARYTGWGKRKLEACYRGFYEMRKEDKEFFCDTQEEAFKGIIETNALNELHDMGIDFPALYASCAEELVKTEVEMDHKITRQKRREARDREKNKMNFTPEGK